MSTFEIDDQACFHAKVVRAGNEAFGAWCRAGSWCAAHLTDGYVTRDIAVTIAETHVWCRLRDCGLPGSGLVEEVEGGYQIHQWDHWQRTASEVLHHRAEQAKRQKNRRAALRAGVPVTQSVTRDKRSTYRVSTDQVTPTVPREYSTPDPDPDPSTDPDLLSASVPPSAPPTLVAAAPPAFDTAGEQPKKKRAPRPRKPNPERPAGHPEVVDFYFVAFERARGVKPSFGGREGSAVSRLLDAVKGDVAKAQAIVEAAYSDPWWSTRATILDIAKDPAKFLGRQPSLVQRSPAGHSAAVFAREQREYEERLAKALPDPLADAMREIDQETHL